MSKTLEMVRLEFVALVNASVIFGAIADDMYASETSGMAYSPVAFEKVL